MRPGASSGDSHLSATKRGKIENTKGTKEYADSVLAGIEVALQDAMKVIQNNRKELK